MSLDAVVLAIAEARSERAREHGAQAVMLTGSHLRGTAHAESDIDLYCIGAGPEYELAREQGYLISESWLTTDACRAAMRDPRLVGGVIPGWRRAHILYDPQGVAAHLQLEALAWTWDVIGSEVLDRWVAEQVTGFAEEVHKLVIALERDRPLTAAAQRSILALRLPFVVAAQQRILYDSENDVWDMLSEHLGEEWEQAQRWALEAGVPLRASCTAALRMYRMIAGDIFEQLNERERAVVQHALDLASAVR